MIKIGYTNKNAEERIANFSKNYEVNFKKVAEFEIKNESALKIERFIHKFLNAQFLNVKMIYDKFNIVEYESYVKDKNDGYTEIFLCNHAVLTNLITFFHISGFLTITNNELDEISQIKSFDENTLKTHYQNILRFIDKEGKKDLFGSPNLITKRTNIFEKNWKSWKSKSLDDLELTYKNSILKIKHNEGFTSISNFIFGNNDVQMCQLLVQNCVSNITKEDMLKIFDDNLQKIINQNESFSPHNRRFSKEEQESLLFRKKEKIKQKIESYLTNNIYKDDLIKILELNVKTFELLKNKLNISDSDFLEFQQLKVEIQTGNFYFDYSINRKTSDVYADINLLQNNNLSVYSKYILENINEFINNCGKMKALEFKKNDDLLIAQIKELEKYHNLQKQIEEAPFLNLLKTNEFTTVKKIPDMNLRQKKIFNAIVENYNSSFSNKNNKFIIKKQNEFIKNNIFVDLSNLLAHNFPYFQSWKYVNYYPIIKEEDENKVYKIRKMDENIFFKEFLKTWRMKDYISNIDLNDFLNTKIDGDIFRKKFIKCFFNNYFNLNFCKKNKQLKNTEIILKLLSKNKNFTDDEWVNLKKDFLNLKNSNYTKYVSSGFIEVAQEEILKYECEMKSEVSKKQYK